MNFDKFLDFLFHKFAGIAFAFCGTMLAIFALSSCIPLDCAGCFCETACGEGCGDCYIDCSEECDMICYECFEAFSCTSDDGNGMLDCLLGDGCYTQCGDCYTECGGVNISCWRAVCTEGICPSCTNDYYGDLVCTYLNCVTYCGGNPGYDDGYDDYYDDGGCDGCGGCGGCGGNDSGYDDGYGGGSSNNDSYYYSIDLYFSDGSYYNTKSVYGSTYSLPYTLRDGYEFRGYFTSPNGQGRQITDSSGYLLDKYNYTYTGYAYYVPLKQNYHVEIYKNNEFLGSSSISSDTHLEDFILRHLESSQEFNTLNAYFDVDGYTYQLFSNGVYQFPSSYFDPNYINAMSGSTVKLYLSSMIDITIREHDGYYRDYSVPYGTTAGDLRAQVPTVSGMLFAGFYYESGSSGEYIPDNTAFTGNVTLIAVYTEQISFTLKDDYGNRTTYQVASGTKFDFAAPNYTKDGMKFIGWCPVDGYLNNGTQLTEGNYLSGSVTVNSNHDDLTFIPMWKPETYTISYYVNGSLYSTASYTYGVGRPLLTEVPSDFETFAGWSMNYDLSGSTYTSISTYDYGDKSFYAVFTSKVFELVLNPSNGTVSPTTVSVTYGTKRDQYAIQLPSRPGYEFSGWYFMKNGVKTMLTKANGVGILDFDKDTFGVSTAAELESIVLYADWNVETYQVIFRVNGNVYHTASVEHGSTVTAPTEPTVPGYTFGGWLNYGVPFNFDTPVTSAMELTAKLNPKQYRIILEFATSDEFFAWPGTDGMGYYDNSYEVFCTFGETMFVDWMSEVEPWNALGKTLVGWSYNGEIVIDAEGNVVNKELLASITPDGSGKIHLIAVWE